MKVFTVTNMWPLKDFPYYGVFVKEQVEALQKHYPNINNKIYFINGKKNKLNYIWSIFNINWLLLINKYDVIHIHYALSGIFLLFNPFRKSRVILTLHGSDFYSKNFYKRLVYYVLKQTSIIICLNDTMLSQLKKHNKEIHLIPCGVDTEFFKASKSEVQEDVFKVVFPSSKLREVKNYVLFDKIIQFLKVEHQLKIETIELNNKSRLEVNSILNSADLLCMTSLTEGSPQVIKEAMCCNTPIVSSNVGDVERLLKNVSNCYVIDSYKVEDFSNVILKILKLPKENRVTNGRLKIFELGLNEKNISSKIINVYLSIIGNDKN